MNEFAELVHKLNGIQNNKKELPILSSDSNEIPNGKKVIMETANILKELDRISTEKRMVANPRLEEDYTNEDLLGDLQSRYANFLNPSAVTEDDEGRRGARA